MKKITRNGEKDFLVYREGSGNTIEIFDIAVESERGKGVGTSMVRELIQTVRLENKKTVWAITRSSNFVAQQFYESLGFRVVGVLRDFYKDEICGHVDALMYGLDL